MNYNYLLFLILVPVFVLGCFHDINAESPLPESEFFETHSGENIENGTFTTKQAKVIGNQVSYNRVLLNYTSLAPATLDFSKGTVLLVDMGQRNSGGYAIGTTSVNVSENFVVVNVSLSIPGENCAVSLALTNPYQFIFIPTKKEVLISEKLTVAQCEG
ncbi:MAG: protease complex subunit PrcB family protein [Gammaproteobacteria bacterium]|nr:protease complex subunit PrcB family protein [Gammaproteobacteria bacterium]